MTKRCVTPSASAKCIEDLDGSPHPMKRQSMKTLHLLVTLTALAIAPAVLAQKGPNKPEDPAPAPPTPPPVYENPPITTAAPQPPAAPAQAQPYVYDQQPMGTRPVLITQDQAQTI